MAVWMPYALAARIKAGQMHKVKTLVVNGDISSGLELYDKLDPVEQGLVKGSLSGALQDCADFLDPTQNYGGDKFTWERIIELPYIYEFAQRLAVSNDKLDDLVGIHDSFSDDKFRAALKSVRAGEKTIPVDEIIRNLKATSPATTNQLTPG